MEALFSLVKRGYNPQEVDEYIQTLEQVINNYKEKDNAIKNAIISAQVAADNIVKNAQNQANEYRNNIVHQLNRLYEAIHLQKDKLRAFQEDYNQMLSKYLVQFNEKDVSVMINRIDELEQYLVGLDDVDGKKQ